MSTCIYCGGTNCGTACVNHGVPGPVWPDDVTAGERIEALTRDLAEARAERDALREALERAATWLEHEERASGDLGPKLEAKAARETLSAIVGRVT